MTIKRIKQKKYDKGDCGVACVAMVTERSYKSIKDAFIKFGLVDAGGNYYTSHKDLICLFDKINYSTQRKKFKSWNEVQTPSIVKINPRKGNYWHWVVLVEENGKKIMFDPKPDSPGRITSFRGKKGAGQYLLIEERC